MSESSGKEIKVFISSTFRDLNDQRSYLVNVVFPTLRRKLDVPVFEIDLRWGITDEEARRNNVVDICLKYLYRSRPYFIGILGDRYGSLSDPATSEISAETEGFFPDVKNHINERRSITEIEIINGVLESPVPIRGIFFLKRNIKKYPGETDEMYRRQCALHERIKSQKVYPWYEFDDDYKTVFDVLMPFFEESLGKKNSDTGKQEKSFAATLLESNKKVLEGYRAKFIDSPSVLPALRSIKDSVERLSSNVAVIRGDHQVGKSVIMSQFHKVLGKTKSKKKEIALYFYGDRETLMPNYEDVKEYILTSSKQEIEKILESGSFFGALIHGIKVGMKSQDANDIPKNNAVELSMHKIWIILDNFNYTRAHNDNYLVRLIDNIQWAMKSLSNLAQQEIDYQIVVVADNYMSNAVARLPYFRAEFYKLCPKETILRRLLDQYSKHLDPRVYYELLLSPLSNYGGLLEMLFKYMVSYVKHEELENFVKQSCKITNIREVYKLYTDQLVALVGKDTAKKIFAVLMVFWTGLSREDLAHVIGLDEYKLNEALLCVEPFLDEETFRLRDRATANDIRCILGIDDAYIKDVIKGHASHFKKDIKYKGTWEWFANNYERKYSYNEIFKLGRTQPRFNTIEEEIDYKYLYAVTSSSMTNMQLAMRKFKDEDPEGYAKASAFERAGIAEQKYLDQDSQLRPVSVYALMHYIEALLHAEEYEELYKIMKDARAVNNLSRSVRYHEAWVKLREKGFNFPYKEIYKYQAYRRDRLRNIAEALHLSPSEMQTE